ncbi:MAG: HEAT repeat domain-containing protein [Drouetiella hepatica Uher 2000/2452]|jgi:HEAT repeat protein|uniref:HEAT repeat domain-containing protein n=1 Tax=Drouetiella hepatica Uher 2000/2452 TaxID=904376 RepID=A0A951QD89_9CYAN|nr:HEAT repeat domain-containing protein [Drouetiella hepatica Uher 2000/2452]
MKKKILVLVSNPKGTTNLDLLPEIQKLKEALRRSQHQKRFTVEWEVAVRQTDLRRHILDVKPQIIHFCGHGTEQGLVLEDDMGTAKVVSNEFLVDLLRVFADRIECVLLNACDSENLADALAQHLNYVIGMNQEVRDDAAIAFAEGFYDTLGAGETYERAFEAGKNAVLGRASSRHAPSRKGEVIGEDGSPVKGQNQEHLIPVLKTNLNPTPIKPLWLSPAVEQDAVRQLLGAIESGFNTIRLFHADEPIVLKDQYIPVQVTLERRYQHTVETIGGYAESEAELKRIYALKGGGEEEIKRQQVDWQEARRQQSRIVVLADPGMGKSTLLRMEVGATVQQAYQALETDRPLKDMTLPLFIRLSTLADEIAAMSTEEAILKIIQERHSNLLKHHADAEVVVFLNGFLKEQLLSGKVLLLLDALDEVPDGKRKKLLEKLNEFAKAYPTCAIVGTSRIVGYGGRLIDGAKDTEIVPFNQKQTEEYIETWFRNAPLKDESVSARGLIQALRERPQIAGLAQNPLLLSLICSLYQQDHLTLPVRRCELYEQAVNCMLGRWGPDNKGHDANEGWTLAKKELLEELAYQFSCESKQLFSFGELRKKLEKYLKSGNAPTDLESVKAADLTKELCEQDGILQRWSAEDDRLPIEKRRYLFLHRTFQEYLTASYLSHIDEGEIEFEKLFWNYDWHETLTLLAGLMENPMALIEAIAAEKDDIFQTQLLLAGRCLAECSQISDPLIDKLLDRIYQFWLKYPEAEFIRSVVVAIGQTWTKLVQNLQAALNHEDSAVSRYAVEALGEIGTDYAVDALIAALNHKSQYIRWDTARALGEIGTDKAVDALIAALNDQDSTVRHSVTGALGKIGTDKAVDALIAALNHEDRGVGYWAAEALGKIGTDKAVDALIAALNHEDRGVRHSVTRALGKIGNDKAVDALIAALNHEDSTVRTNAAEALGKIGTDKAVDALIAALNHEDSTVRTNAAEALGKIGTDKAVDALIAALNHEDSTVRYRVAGALGKIGTDKAVDALIAALNDQDSTVRHRVAGALGKIGTDKAVDALIAALNDQYSAVRERAAEALGRIGTDKAVDALIAALNDQDSTVRHSVTGALGRIGTDKAINTLITALNHEDKYVGYMAAGALGKIGTDKAVDTLIAALNDQDSTVRYRVAEALGKIGNDKAVDALIAALNHEDRGVGYWAAEALGKIGTDKAVDALIAALNHEDSTVRTNAAEALGKIGNDKAVDALIAALNDQDSTVRYRVAGALGKIGTDKAVDALIAALNDNDGHNQVRYRAEEVLRKIGTDKAVDALIAALNDNDGHNQVRYRAEKVLRKIGTDKAVDALIAAFNDNDGPNYDIRGAAAALEQIGNDKAVDALITALNDQNSADRERAAKALGRIGTDKAVDALITALNHETSDVGDNAVAALEKIGRVDCLEKLLQSAAPDLIYRSDLFPLARRWAIRFSKDGLPFIPVYPEWVKAAKPIDRAED